MCVRARCDGGGLRSPILHASRDLNAVVRWAGAVAVEQLFGQTFQRATQEEDQHRQADADSQDDPVTQAANDAEHGTHPNRRSRGEAGDVAGGIAQNYTRTQKSNACQDTLDDPPDGVLVGGSHRSVGRPEHDDRGDGRSEADQRVSPQAGRLSVQLAVQPEKAAKEQRGAETQGGFFISA